MPASPREFKQAVILNTLRSGQLFSGLPQPDLEAIAGLVTVKSLNKGDYLFHEGDLSVGFYLVQTGAINVHRVTATGKEQTIHVFRAGESFAEATLATERGYPADARATEPSQVLLIQKAGFVELLRQRPELALRMLAAMSTHLRVLVGQIEEMTLRDVETRLANWLLRRCPDPQSPAAHTVELRGTKRDLATELGTISETLSRTLSKFRERKLLLVEGRKLTVRNPREMTAVLARNLGEAEP